MPVKIFKKWLHMAEEKDMSEFENTINQFEILIEKEGMLIDSITMACIGQSGDAYCMVHYRPTPTRR
jgi:hypothetical protein